MEEVEGLVVVSGGLGLYADDTRSSQSKKCAGHCNLVWYSDAIRYLYRSLQDYLRCVYRTEFSRMFMGVYINRDRRSFLRSVSLGCFRRFQITFKLLMGDWRHADAAGSKVTTVKKMVPPKRL